MVIEWPPVYVPKFSAALRDVHSRDKRFRKKAAVALGRAADSQKDEARKALEHLLSDAYCDVRLEAIYALARIRAVDSAGEVKRFLASSIKEEKMASLHFFMEAGRKEDFDSVKKLTSVEEDEDVRSTALGVLSHLDEKRAREIVLSVIKSAEKQSLCYLHKAVSVLGEIGDAHDYRFLTPLISHPSVGIRIRVASAFCFSEQIGNYGKQIFSILSHGALMVRDEELKWLCIEGLCRLKGDDVLAFAKKRFSKIFLSRREKIYWAGICCRDGYEKGCEYLNKVYRKKKPSLASEVLQVAGFCRLKSWIGIMTDNVINSIKEGKDCYLFDSISALGLMQCRESLDVLKRLRKELSDRDEQILQLLNSQIFQLERFIERSTSRQSKG